MSSKPEIDGVSREFVLVPREPTPEMRKAAFEASDRVQGCFSHEDSDVCPHCGDGFGQPDGCGHAAVAAYTAMLNAAPPELAELQATIAEMTEAQEAMQSVIDTTAKAVGDNTGLMWMKIQTAFLREIPELRAEIERLKGGQGKPVAWQLDVEGYKTVTIDNYQRALSEQEHFQGRGRTAVVHSLYRSQPAPVSVVLPEREGPTTNYVDAYKRGWNACLDKVKELNQ